MYVRKSMAAAGLIAAMVVGFAADGLLGGAAEARRPRTRTYICSSHSTVDNRTAVHNPSTSTVSFTVQIFDENGASTGAPVSRTLASRASTSFDSGVATYVKSRSRLIVSGTQGDFDAIHDLRCT
jgi:hypothetical protein